MAKYLHFIESWATYNKYFENEITISLVLNNVLRC
jgi:hypothetical protein